jgi:hypothetical protein
MKNNVTVLFLNSYKIIFISIVIKTCTKNILSKKMVMDNLKKVIIIGVYF